MAEIGRHGRNITWLLGAEVFQKLLSVVFFVVLSRTLSVVENGWYGIFVALFPVLLAINGAGLYEVAVRDLSQKKPFAQGIAAGSILTQCLLFVPIAVFSWGLVRLLNYPLELQRIVLLTSILALLMSVAKIQHAILAAAEEFKYVSILNALLRIIVVVGALILLYSGYGVVAILVYLVPAHALHVLMSYAVSRWRCGGYTFNPFQVDMKYLLSEGLVIAFGALVATAYYSVNMFLLTSLGSPEAPGYYSIAFRFYMMLAIVPVLIGTVTYPILSRKVAETDDVQRDSLERCIKLAILLGLPAAIGLTVLGENLVVTLCGEKFVPSTLSVIVLTWVLASEMLNRSLVVFFRARAKQSTPLLVYATALSAKVLLCLYIIPRHGINGLLIVDGLLALAISGALLGFTRATLPTFRLRRLALRVLIRPAAAALLMGAALWFLRAWPIAATVPLGAILYGAALILVRSLDDFDRRMIKETLGI